MKQYSLSKNKKLGFSSTGVSPVQEQAEACGCQKLLFDCNLVYIAFAKNSLRLEVFKSP